MHLKSMTIVKSSNLKSFSMKSALLSLALLLLFACQPPSPKKKTAEKPGVDPKILVSCEGIGEIKVTDTYEGLKQKFGAK